MVERMKHRLTAPLRLPLRLPSRNPALTKGAGVRPPPGYAFVTLVNPATNNREYVTFINPATGLREPIAERTAA